MQSLILRLMTLLLILASSEGYSQISARAQLSDVGAGVELGYREQSKWGLRIGYLLGDLDVDFDAEDSNGFEGDELEYESDVELENTYLLVDWHPWNRYFRLSGGFFLNNSHAKIVTRCNAQALIPGTATCEFGDSRFSDAILGEVTTKVDFDQFAPYLGVGWGHRPAAGFAFNVDLGVVHLGSANVRMSSDGSCNSNAACQSELRKEESEIEDELDDYRLLPYISLGLSYLF